MSKTANNGNFVLERAMSVAVAVKGGQGGLGGKGSRRAVRWALMNFFPDKADRLVLIHVVPPITSIPTPSGDLIPISEVDASVVAMYVEDTKARFQEIFIPFKRLCKNIKVETLVLEADSSSPALLTYVSNVGIKNLVLGSCSYRFLRRKFKGLVVPSDVLKQAPSTCNVYVVSRYRLIRNSSDTSVTSQKRFKCWLGRKSRSYHGISKGSSTPCSFSLDSKVHSTTGLLQIQGQTNSDSQDFIDTGTVKESNSYPKLGDIVLENQSIARSSSVSTTCTEQSYLQGEVEQLRLELQNMVSMYNQACKDLVHAHNKVHMLSSECLEDARRVTTAMKREETFRKVASDQKEKHLEAVKEVEMAKSLLGKEVCESNLAELKSLNEYLEKQKTSNALLLSDRRYKRYSMAEIEVATDFFSETRVIGEGAYGKVYKGSLDHTPVAIKVLRPDASEKKQEFLMEVEVLSQLHHPHMVLLLGACPESGCLVYEYMENGSLEDYISNKTNKSPLPWFTRFRVVFEVACGLAFLHNSKPEPIVHRDLKPGNILLDKNFVSKIGDVGLAKLITEVVPDSITEYRETVLAGTFYYMDPEYQRTGTVRPKSDLYGFGIIILQLLTSRHPQGLLVTVEKAIASGSFSDILDSSVTDWPLAEAEELAQIAVKCAGLRCRDRPDLESEVIPVLRRLSDFADSSRRKVRNNTDAPSHYYCPILQEVMEDPHIAADGFTYEYRAIKLWLERQNVSPLTKRKLQHEFLIPNHTLRSAIQEWRSHARSSTRDL